MGCNKNSEIYSKRYFVFTVGVKEILFDYFSVVGITWFKKHQYFSFTTSL